MNRAFSIITVLLILFLFVFVLVYQSKEELFYSDKQTVLVKNGAGKGVDAVVPAHPKRVVFLNSSSLELWLGTGGKDNVAACVKFEKVPEELYEKLDSSTVLLQISGNNISIEEILKQNPDLVIGSGLQLRYKESLEKMGIPTLMLDNRSLEDTYYELSIYGAMNRRTDLATKEIDRIKKNVEATSKSYENKKKPKVALIWGMTSSFALITPNSRQGDFLALAGGENILKKEASSARQVPISLEYIAKEDPDYIFFITMGDDKKIQVAIDNILSEESSWKLLRAVKENNVYVLPRDLFTSYYGLYVDDSIKYMNKLLYPDV